MELFIIIANDPECKTRVYTHTHTHTHTHTQLPHTHFLKL